MMLFKARSLAKGLALPLLLASLGGCLTAGGEVDSDSGSDPVTGDNSAPVISGSPASAITIGQTYSFIPSASDPDGDALTFSIENRPSWAELDPNTGRLAGEPTLGNEGSYSDITISVSDGQATASLRAFTITVTQSSSGSATLSLIAPSENTDGTPFTDLAAFKIYYGLTPGDYPNDVFIDNPGLTTYVVENLAPGTYYFVATAINGYGIESAFSNEVTRVVE